MEGDKMAARLASYRSIVKELGAALKDFQASSSRFRVLKTIHSESSTPRDARAPSESESPRTLFILDSSFNPPSIAHRTLVQSALAKRASDPLPSPQRLLLLFATMNADKAPSAAGFDHRLAMMTMFARDLLDSLQAAASDYAVVPIDIGVTTVPYYTDKSAAIEAEGAHWYPSRPMHTHLIGFDTLTRFFAAKYYRDFDPPFSALEPYFGNGHGLRVTLRPDDEYGSVEEQEGFVRGIGAGELEKDGGKREWARQISLVPPNPRAGVSSTRVRKAAKRGDWDEVSQLCTPTISEWLRSERLYDDDDEGAKMA